MAQIYALTLLYNKLYNYEPNLALSIYNQVQNKNILFVVVYSYYTDILIFNTNLYLSEAKQHIKEKLNIHNKAIHSILIPDNKYMQIKCNYLVGWPYNQDYTYNIIDSLTFPLNRQYAYLDKHKIILGYQNQFQYLKPGKIIKFALSYDEENFDKEMYFIPCN